MITGYNTDVEHNGVVYHVQTEDKGLPTPEIISLVFVSGEILASKRAPYNDLIALGFDESVLTKRLQRQHKLICAAVHAGRIDDLRRMTERESGQAAKQSQATTEGEKARAGEPSAQLDGEAERQRSGDRLLMAESASADEGLVVRLIEERELRGGQTVDLHLLVTRAVVGAGREPASNARVMVKTLGTTFSPQSSFLTTNDRGVATVSVMLPDFKAGRAVILLRAEDHGQTAELRRIILPAT